MDVQAASLCPRSAASICDLTRTSDLQVCALGALRAGHTVAGTVRQARDAESFHALEPERTHPYLLDVTHDGDVVHVVDDVEATVTADFGRWKQLSRSTDFTDPA